MVIYDLPGIVKMALSLSAAPRKAGFICTGIWPFHKDVFNYQDFSPSFVTDRPEESSYRPHMYNNTEWADQSLVSSSSTSATNIEHGTNINSVFVNTIR